jgi:hypothetical protein
MRRTKSSSLTILESTYRCFIPDILVYSPVPMSFPSSTKDKNSISYLQFITSNDGSVSR